MTKPRGLAWGAVEVLMRITYNSYVKDRVQRLAPILSEACNMHIYSCGQGDTCIILQVD